MGKICSVQTGALDRIIEGLESESGPSPEGFSGQPKRKQLLTKRVMIEM